MPHLFVFLGFDPSEYLETLEESESYEDINNYENNSLLGKIIMKKLCKKLHHYTKLLKKFSYNITTKKGNQKTFNFNF